ncbi:hypothetical protein [Dasania marina]|uniref:hypothetical protein n=1 Tax=Dasania marina TaxID=471499 RepID=UPI0030DCBFBE|tara:strand:- start:19243 stop:19395 length:153 start_codon:yes stop_codon:yes gene_type:complete
MSTPNDHLFFYMAMASVYSPVLAINIYIFHNEEDFGLSPVDDVTSLQALG